MKMDGGPACATVEHAQRFAGEVAQAVPAAKRRLE